MNTLVVGLGNPILTDDGVGVKVGLGVIDGVIGLVGVIDGVGVGLTGGLFISSNISNSPSKS